MAKAVCKRGCRCSFLHHAVRAENQYIAKNRAGFWRARVSYIYHIGQYLPDWHLGKLQGFFCGGRRHGGVREILGIELPWLVDAFGRWKRYGQQDKLTALEITVCDSVFVSLRHQNVNKRVFGRGCGGPKAGAQFWSCFGERAAPVLGGQPQKPVTL